MLLFRTGGMVGVEGHILSPSSARRVTNRISLDQEADNLADAGDFGGGQRFDVFEDAANGQSERFDWQ